MLLQLMLLLQLLLMLQCHMTVAIHRFGYVAFRAGGWQLKLAFLGRLVASRYQIYVSNLFRCGKRQMGGLYEGGGAEISKVHRARGIGSGSGPTAFRHEGRWPLAGGRGETCSVSTAFRREGRRGGGRG